MVGFAPKCLECLEIRALNFSYMMFIRCVVGSVDGEPKKTTQLLRYFTFWIQARWLNYFVKSFSQMICQFVG